MSASKTFHGVTNTIFECVKKTSKSEHGTVYQPAQGDSGTATTSTIVGDVVVGFDLDPKAEAIVYTIKKKPFIVSDDQIFNGISESINACRAK
ncbi:hypothetical protein [Ruegeria sp. EL01]|jgi:hypothetical protein|uniref:hypothetical protein n=1 Tax=Ruegeria sp. EL01 TaxID=2107578 RepID=UPI000EA7F38E|nr:hypothetical protein [Ruegeria sp. EL01]